MSLLCFSFLTCYKCFVFYDNILNIASSRYCCVGGHELSKTIGGRIACGKHTHSIVNPIFLRHSLYNINKMAVMLKIKVQNGLYLMTMRRLGLRIGFCHVLEFGKIIICSSTYSV
jgi:hypothetical protein